MKESIYCDWNKCKNEATHFTNSLRGMKLTCDTHFPLQTPFHCHEEMTRNEYIVRLVMCS